MSNSIKYLIKTVGAFVIVTCTFAFAFSFYAAIPDVHISHSTDECVTVINYTDEDIYSCENMPTKYNKVWVK